jgi:hypothetical protein
MTRDHPTRASLEPINSVRIAQLVRLERRHPLDYQRVLAWLNPDDKKVVLGKVEELAGQSLPPAPAPGQVKFGTRGAISFVGRT